MDAFAAALAHHKAGDFAAAARHYRIAVEATPENDDAWGNLGLVLARGDAPEAEAALLRAVELRPEKAGHHYNLGNYYARRGRIHEAADAYGWACRLQPDLPDLAFNYGAVRLALGDFAAGWPLYEERPGRQRTKARQLRFPEWRGEWLEGRRLFIWIEQGFGDQILAARYLRRLPAAKVTWACSPSLVRLFSLLPAEVVACEDPIVVAPHDYWCLPMSMPRWLGGPLWDGPYLAGEAAKAGRFGLAWRGNARPDPGRSLPEPLAHRLLAQPGAVSLDPEESGAGDFKDTADLIAGLDFVVSIDSAVAHLAGAMGKPVWLLLQKQSADWRWTQPWYPDVRIFRQPVQGDWAGVVSDVEAALA